MAKQWKGRTVTADMLMGDEETAPPHIKEVRRIVSAYKKQALTTLFNEDPDYRAQVYQSRDEQIRAFKGDFSVKKTEEFLNFR
jgi:predicted metal-binding protein